MLPYEIFERRREVRKVLIAAYQGKGFRAGKTPNKFDLRRKILILAQADTAKLQREVHALHDSYWYHLQSQQGVEPSYGRGIMHHPV